MNPSPSIAYQINAELIDIMLNSWGSIPSDEEMATRGSVDFKIPSEGFAQLIYGWDGQPLATFTYTTTEGTEALVVKKHYKK